MKEEQNISIRIANQPPVRMTIRPEDEEIIRKAESGVNQLWGTWRQRFDTLTPLEVMGIVALQFARYYYSAEADAQAAAQQLKAFEEELDELIMGREPHNKKEA